MAVLMYTGSILPKYRGASPIQQSVLNGDSKTGITTMYMEEKMDTGNIIEQSEIEIERIDTSKTMFEKLAILGAKTLVSTLRMIEENNGNIVSIKQNDDDATYTSMITKEMAIIDFNKSFEEIYNKIRGLNDFLVARTMINNKIYKIWKAEDKIYTLDEIKQNYNDFEIIKREDSLGNELEIIIIKERKDKKLLFKCNDRIYKHIRNTTRV